MKLCRTVAYVLALTVLVGGLAACRTTKKPQQPAAPVVRAAAPSYAPVVTTTPARPPAARPPSAVYMGSPDAPAAGLPMPFPPTAAAPMGLPPSVPAAPFSDASGVIAAAQESRLRMEQELVELEERVRHVELAARAPIRPGAQVVPAAPRLAGEAQAERFAATLRGKTQGEVVQNGSIVIVRLVDAFLPGSERLKADPGVATALLATAEELAQVPGAEVKIVGHSDATPITKSDWDSNVHLSQARARTVAMALSKHGVPAARLLVTGMGSAAPLVAPETTAGDRARNRRVEVHIRF